MSGNAPELTVRRHERLECAVPARLRVAEQCIGAFRLARASGQDSFEATIVDISDGGIGLRTRTFVPKACWLEVLLDSDSTSANELDPVLVRVQRVMMLDRTPIYYLGSSFSKEEADRLASRALIEHVRQQIAGGADA